MIDGGYNDDTIVGGPGPDTLAGDHPTGECGIYWCKLPAGNDTIDARDGERDSVTCGFGTDAVKADAVKADAVKADNAVDVVAGDCEKVDRPGGPGPKPDPRPGQGLALKVGKAKLAAALTKGLRVRVTASGAGKLAAAAPPRASASPALAACLARAPAA